MTRTTKAARLVHTGTAVGWYHCNDEKCPICGISTQIKEQAISAALQRNLQEATDLNSAWLILRSLADEAFRSYDLDTGMRLVRASGYVNTIEEELRRLIHEEKQCQNCGKTI